MGDHYLLPGALTARSARARREKNRLGYAASKKEMCREGLMGKRGREEEREGRNTDRHYPPATLRGVGEKRRNGSKETNAEKKRRSTNVLLPTVPYSYFYSLCVESRDFADDCTFCRRWGSN